MAQRICNYSISLFVMFLWLTLPLSAQNAGRTTGGQRQPAPRQQKDKDKDDVPQYPLYNGVSVGIDLWGIGSNLVGSDFLSSEIAVDVDLKHRFFPTLELGYGKTDAWNDTGIRYETAAPYFRIGLDYNALYKKKHGQMLLVGVRYGVTSFKYDIEALAVDDPIFGGSIGNPNLEDDVWGGSLPYDYAGMKGSMQWIEFCLGLRAHIYKGLYMGWSLRMKYRLTSSTGTYGDPWYVPGFGKYNSNAIGVTYTLTYKLPF